jgi:hypothetical protein
LKKCEKSRQSNQKKNDSDAKNQSPNRGKSIVDATCTPADISYPTDLGVLNAARIHTGKILGILYKQIQEKAHKKSTTYRNLARKNYLAVANKKLPTRTKKRQEIKKI